MLKFTAVIFAVIACTAAKPDLIGALLSYTTSVVAAAPAPFVPATSNQVIARNYNGIRAAPLVGAAVPIGTYSGPLVARYAAAPASLAYSAYLAAPLAYTTPLEMYSAPLTYASHFAAAARLVL